MGRLYYEKQNDPLQPKAVAGEKEDFNNYLDKVTRLIPTEVIAGYLTMIGFAETIKNEKTQNIFIWFIFLIGLALTPLYLNNVAESDKPKRNHLILSTLAFVIWCYVTTGKLLLETISLGDIYEPAIASITLVSFSLISAIIPLNK
ncbi:hypothetical protein [uncultured Chryseobacterium sp.]|uniref:hypothetical protein n=1 Tax=uncultured Chryseobacterium sp. TaxID=259322 RepID=UPI00374A73FE